MGRKQRYYTQEELDNWEENGKFRAMVKIERFVYQEDNFYILGVAPIKIIQGKPCYNQYGNITVKGYMTEPPRLRQEYMLVGQLVYRQKDGKYEPSYNTIYFGEEIISMEDKTVQRDFLKKILTPAQYTKLYAAFEDPFEIIKNKDKDTLCKASGIKEYTAQKIIDSYFSKIGQGSLLAFIERCQINIGSLSEIINAFGSAEGALFAIKENPYSLLKVKGFGFKKTDAFALKMGISPTSPYRYKALIMYLIEKAPGGQTYVTGDYLQTQVRLFFQEHYIVDVFQTACLQLQREGWLFINEFRTLFASMQNMFIESRIYKELMRLQNAPSILSPVENVEEKLQKIEEKQGFPFTQEQRDTIQMVLDNNVVIITGKGGTGKTSVANGFLNIIPKNELKYCLCALSGRAACRIAEVSGLEASTIHKLLTKSSLSSANVVVLDEATMVETELFYKLIKDIPDGCKLIVMGDIAQLETIGKGNVFGDLLDTISKETKRTVLPVSKLTQIHRQAADSGIIVEAAKVAEGLRITPQFWTGTEKRGIKQDLLLDIFNYDETYKDKSIEKVINYWLESFRELKDIRKIAVLTARRETNTLNVRVLNEQIQQLYNPSDGIKSEIRYRKRIQEKKDDFRVVEKGEKEPEYYIVQFREGDRVMNTRNNYAAISMAPEFDPVMLLHSDNKNYLDTMSYHCRFEKIPIFNGFLGTIEQVSEFGMIINFDAVGRVFIDVADFNDIDLGYASTVHKYQGSECHTVIFAVDRSSGIGGDSALVTRQLVYTGITRAREQCILVTDDDTLEAAIIRNNKVSTKCTLLKRFIEGSVPMPTLEQDKEYADLLEFRRKKRIREEEAQAEWDDMKYSIDEDETFEMLW